MMRTYVIVSLLMATLLTTGCGANQSAKQEQDYEQTKKMVVDIVQTDDGKKALQEVLKDEKMKKELVMDSDTVKKAVMDTIVSDDAAEMWKKLFEDPMFVETFIKATEEQQKKLFTSLMSDAAFQKKMIELMQNPELEQQTLTLLKGQQFKEHLEKSIEETLDTPLFRAKMEKELLKAAEKKKQSEEGGQGKGGSGGGSKDSGGGSGGGTG